MIAIKQSEAAALEALTQRTVFSLPYRDDRCIQSAWIPAILGCTIMADHFGSGAHNSVNIVNFGRFLSIFARYIVLYKIPVEVVIGGNMCEGSPKIVRSPESLAFSTIAPSSTEWSTRW